MRAEVGDVVFLSPAKGWYAPPSDAGWQLLLADMTALPALGRIVEQLPAGTRAIAVTELTDLWTFQRDLRSADPTWKLVATRSQ